MKRKPRKGARRRRYCSQKACGEEAGEDHRGESWREDVLPAMIQ
jgi:hypothetical protein